MANEFIATFEGSVGSFRPNFKLHNGSNQEIGTVAFSGKTAQFPITWDNVGEMKDSNVGDPTKPFLAGKRGEDEEVVYMYFYGFKPGETLYFSGGDLDFTGDSSSVVPVEAIEGTKVLILLGNGYPYTGEFKVNEGRMEAVISIS